MTSDSDSLLTLEEELTCSICLSTFFHPVTTPCGHNFCQQCLLETWKDSYCCPQCRTVFGTKPELKKNTVLCTVVDTFNLRVSKDKVEVKVVLCDTCMEADAVKTCLTCMASFCEQHLMPHQVNPIYSVHQLNEPICDLKERICSQHHKLMEVFCTQHLQLICSQCLQSQHRGCSFTPPEEHRAIMESELREKMYLLDQKMEKTNSVINQIKENQSKLKDCAANRKRMLSSVYQQIHRLLEKDEEDAQQEVIKQLEECVKKHQEHIKNLSRNKESMNNAKEKVLILLSHSQSMAFLQASFELPKVVKSDPHVPGLTLDSKKVLSFQRFVDSLKESLTETFKQPVEARTPSLKAESSEKKEKPKKKAQDVPLQIPAQHWRASLDDKVLLRNPKLTSNAFPSSSRGRGGAPQRNKKTNAPMKQTLPTSSLNHRASSMSDLLEIREDRNTGRFPAAGRQDGLATVETRRNLLRYGTSLTLDPRTANLRIVLSEDFTRASVPKENPNYLLTYDCPQRFAFSTQVMAIQGFSKGCYYWEVNMSVGIGVGLGVTYGSIDRKGPASQLGRNRQSWCLECVDGNISFWHNNIETNLITREFPRCVGVLLEYDVGRMTFYNVDNTIYPFSTFACSFTEPVWPVFWLLSNSSISLCDLRA